MNIRFPENAKLGMGMASLLPPEQSVLSILERCMDYIHTEDTSVMHILVYLDCTSNGKYKSDSTFFLLK